MVFIGLVVLLSCENNNNQLGVPKCPRPTNDYAYLDNYSKPTPCTDSLCLAYQNIWRDLFIERNGLTTDFFTKHIIFIGSGLNTWTEGQTFSVCYEVKVDWAIAYLCDQFIINISDPNSYSDVQVPRGTYLSKNNIRTVLDHSAFSSFIQHVSNSETMQFSSIQDASNYLTQKANLAWICNPTVSLDYTTGELIYSSWSQVDSYQCIGASVNLVTHDTKVAKQDCFVYVY